MYQWRKGIATFAKGSVLCISVPFTWLLDEAENIKKQWPGISIIGGPGTMQPSIIDGIEPMLFHNPCATSTTSGCVNDCSFCAVPHTEGDLQEKRNHRPAPIICDNNLLAASKRHIRRVIDQQKQFPITDFNQGLEAKRFTPEIADMLGEINCKVRFAFDYWGQEAAVKDAIDLCRKRTTADIQVYCLIGFADTPADAKARLDLIRSWGVLPNPMRFQPLDATKKNDYVHPSWSEKELADTMRYYSRLNWLGHIPFSEYKLASRGAQ